MTNKTFPCEYCYKQIPFMPDRYNAYTPNIHVCDECHEQTLKDIS